MNYLRSVFPLLMLLFFSSCDPVLKVRYEVVNNTSKPITVKFKTPFTKSDDTSMQVVAIPKNGSKIINEEEVIGSMDQFEQKRHTIYIYQLSIEQDNKRTNVNFTEKKYWMLKKNGEQEGVYQLLFDTTFFGVK